MPYKKCEFLAFMKKVNQRNGKNPVLVFPGLQYAHKKLRVAVDQKTEFEYTIQVEKSICR